MLHLCSSLLTLFEILCFECSVNTSNEFSQAPNYRASDATASDDYQYVNALIRKIVTNFAGLLGAVYLC